MCLRSSQSVPAPCLHVLLTPLLQLCSMMVQSTQSGDWWMSAAVGEVSNTSSIGRAMGQRSAPGSLGGGSWIPPLSPISTVLDEVVPAGRLEAPVVGGVLSGPLAPPAGRLRLLQPPLPAACFQPRLLLRCLITYLILLPPSTGVSNHHQRLEYYINLQLLHSSASSLLKTR